MGRGGEGLAIDVDGADAVMGCRGRLMLSLLGLFVAHKQSTHLPSSHRHESSPVYLLRAQVLY